jgi:hypothetical protein
MIAMFDVKNVALEALKEYFNILKYKGYLKKEEIHKVLIVSFIEEILEDKFFEYITEEDYNIMISTIYKMIPSSCTLKFPSFNTYFNLVNDIKTSNRFRASLDYPRISEKGIVRTEV